MKLTPIIGSINLIPVLLLATLSTAATTYDPHYLLSCGDQVREAQGLAGQTWSSDNNSTFSDGFSSTTSATTTTTTFNIPRVPFASARIFTTNFTYKFPVSPGPKFIRLFFYPSDSPYTSSSTAVSLYAKDAYLTVQANSDHLLLRNFSAYLSNSNAPSSSNLGFVLREFYVNHVTESPLRLTFFATPPSPHAFVNGIEVVSVPEKLYVGPTSPASVGSHVPFDLAATTALENAYRVNVGGNELGSSEDNRGMNRLWESDAPYLNGDFTGQTGVYDKGKPITYSALTPNYSAPSVVYQTFRSMVYGSNDFRLSRNLTWGFEVDLGFNYLVRLHWCEVVRDINASGYRVFDVYIHDQIAEQEVDIFAWVGGYTAVYKDYAVYMNPDGRTGSRGLLKLALHPNIEKNPNYLDVLLNGLEIFKINRPDGSLDAPNPITLPSNKKAPPPLERSASHIAPLIIGVIAGVILLVVLPFFYLWFHRQKSSKTPSTESGTASSKSKRLLSTGKSGGSSSLPTHLCRHFTLIEIRIATSDFSDSLIIGHGGFGNVYRGTVDTDPVAIKRLNPLSSQGAKEFTMEIELLSKLRHVNLVSLIGYCDDAGEMILVYEYMSRGTLRDHLYSHNDTTDPNETDQLTWRGRLEICIGAARALHYLHTGTGRMIIHRDVKSTNILLDERWAAKVSDFGLSKLGPAGEELSHVSTMAKGSFGYVDPEYCRRQQLTEKSDVYSFGVVLFEVLCGRAAVDPSLPKEQVNLRIWARRNQMSGTLGAIVDPAMKDQIVPECLRKFGEVAESCVRDEGAHRPSMADVIGGLELALQLQLESWAKTTGLDIGDDKEFQPINCITSRTTDASVKLIRSPGEASSNWTGMNDDSTSRLFSSSTSEGYGESPAVFSQIFKPEGR